MMHFIYTNKDGTVGTEAALPKRIVRDKDGATFVVEGVARSETQTWLTGVWVSGAGPVFAVDDPAADMADIEEWPGHTIEHVDFEKDILAKMHPSRRDEVVGHRQIKRSDKPADYSFRHAWRDDGKAIVHDMDDCRAITRDRLRKERAPLLVAQDVESLKALEAGDATKIEAVAIEKQRLRDITALPAIEAATTPEQLKAISVAKTAAAIRLR